jgi:hypothetical protein
MGFNSTDIGTNEHIPYNFGIIGRNTEFGHITDYEVHEIGMFEAENSFHIEI